MKLYVMLLFVVSLTAVSAAQTIGVNTFIFKAPNEFSLSFGYGAGFEYSYHLSKNFDLAVEPAFLYSSHNSGLGKTEYLHIPVLAGIRLYIFDYYLKPYISLSAIGSYCSYDLINERSVLDAELKYVESFSKFNAGVNFTFGTMLKITDYWNINLGVGASIISERYADFSGFKLGAAYNLQ